jgi:small subunit ribosomal protein S2
MKELEELDFEGTTSGFTKKELLIKKRELDKLHKSLGGIRNLTKTPSALWVVDTKKEHLAIDEAKKLGIPVIGILDTNCDPDEVQYPIPGNDDAIRSVSLLTRIVADAAAEGLIQRHQKPEEGAEPAEPLAEWERELLHADAEEELPVEENDADAEVAAKNAGKTEDAPVIDAPAPESEEHAEERLEAEATPEEKLTPAEEAEAEAAPAGEAKADEAKEAEEEAASADAAKTDEAKADEAPADETAAADTK